MFGDQRGGEKRRTFTLNAQQGPSMPSFPALPWGGKSNSKDQKSTYPSGRRREAHSRERRPATLPGLTRNPPSLSFEQKEGSYPCVVEVVGDWVWHSHGCALTWTSIMILMHQAKGKKKKVTASMCECKLAPTLKSFHSLFRICLTHKKRLCIPHLAWEYKARKDCCHNLINSDNWKGSTFVFTYEIGWNVPRRKQSPYKKINK